MPGSAANDPSRRGSQGDFASLLPRGSEPAPTDRRGIETLQMASAYQPPDPPRRRGVITQSSEAAADMALEWQIVLHLRQLFERRPELVGELLGDRPDRNSLLARQLLAAAQEAVAGNPRSAELKQRAACVFEWMGDAAGAAALREQAHMLDPQSSTGAHDFRRCFGAPHPRRRVES